MVMTDYAVKLDDIKAAAVRMGKWAHRTPVLTCSTIDGLVSRGRTSGGGGGQPVNLFFKCENFQKVGAFKFRGACNAVMKLPNEQARQGVVTHSSGNHAQALALAAKLRGIAAHIVMPRTSSAVKIRAVEGYGGVITLCEPNQKSREETAERIAKETGATLIPPYNHPDIIAGQGTVALELIEQTAVDGRPALDVIVCPIGGGGLMSGTCIAARGMTKSITIIAAEPALADDAARSLETGVLQSERPPKTIADGLLTAMGSLTWPIVRDHVTKAITVSDEEIIAAMRLVWERMKIIVEPSGAVSVAAVLSDTFRELDVVINAPVDRPLRVGVIISGGNLDLEKIPWVTAPPPGRAGG